MEKILVTGGTGALGREIVSVLWRKGLSPIILSSKNSPDLTSNTDVITGDITNIESIAGIANKFDSIIHCASNPLNSNFVDVEGSKNLLDILNRGKTKHFLYISIAGVDKSTFPYYQDKYHVEKMIMESGIPWTILRATQFHDFILNGILKPLDTGSDSTFKIPEAMKFQSVDIQEVADKTVELLKAGPANTTITFGGPEILTFEEMVRTYLSVSGRKEQVKSIPAKNEFHQLFTSGVNLCPEFAGGTITWESFIKRTLG